MTEKLKIVFKFKTEKFETMNTMEATTDLCLGGIMYGFHVRDFCLFLKNFEDV